MVAIAIALCQRGPGLNPGLDFGFFSSNNINKILLSVSVTGIENTARFQMYNKNEKKSERIDPHFNFLGVRC